MTFEPREAVWGALAGLALGGLYFGGLWWTVNHAVRRSSRPRRLLAVSGVLRLATAVGAFWGLLQVGPVVLLSSILGFLGARQVWLSCKGGRAAGRLGG